MTDPTVSKSGRILVVDDEEGARAALEAVFEDDFNVLCVDSGSQALVEIERDVFDLVLLDLNMPEMDGIETLRQIKAYDTSIAVIMVSAHRSGPRGCRCHQDRCR